ncbi:MAG: hypothetical protein QM726_12930 [Chitinophagaceae bacterium]
MKTQIANVGPRLGEAPESIAKVQANMDKLLTDIANVEQAQADLERLSAILRNTMSSIGAETRDFVKRLKTSPFYTVEDGKLLQIISTTTYADLTDYKPDLTGKVSGGHVHLSFKRHGADGMNIYTRQQGETEWKLLGNAKMTPFIDPRLLANANTAETREYYAIATLVNTEVGQRSDIISIKYAG